jgi:hypothetical protein
MAELVEELNARPFKRLPGCRRSAFESIDRPALKTLPARRFEASQWARARVNIDYHVTFEERLYSVPHALVGERIEIRATASTVEILHAGQRVASHRRSYAPRGTAVTEEHHRPESHRAYGKWPPERLIRVGERHGAARFDAACARALTVSGSTPPRRKFIEVLLKRGIDRLVAPQQADLPSLGLHENIRGGRLLRK